MLAPHCHELLNVRDAAGGGCAAAVAAALEIAVPVGVEIRLMFSRMLHRWG